MAEAKLFNNNEIKQLLESEIIRLSRKVKTKEKELTPFRTFCYHDGENALMAIAQKPFEQGFKTSGYTISDSTLRDKDFSSVLEGKCSKKSIEDAATIVLKDKKIFEHLKKEVLPKFLANNKVLASKLKLNNKPASLIKLLESLYEECSNLNRIRQSMSTGSLEVSRQFYYNECNLCDLIRAIEEQIAYKFGELYTEIDEIKIVIDVLNQLIQFIDNKDSISLNQEKINLLYSVVNPDKKLKAYFSYIEELCQKEAAKKDEERRNSDTYLSIFSPEYIKVLEEQLEPLREKIDEYKEFLDAVAVVSNNADIKDDETSNENTINIIKNSILNVKSRSELIESMKVLLDAMHATNPRRSNFDKLIKINYINLTPKTRKMIPEPNTIGKIIEIFDCYNEFYNDPNTSNAIKVKIDKIIEEIATKIIEIAKVIKKQHYCCTVNKRTYDKMVEGISKRKYISLTGEEQQEFLSINKDVYSDAPKEAQDYFEDIISDIKEYNDNMPGRIARKRAKTIKTQTLNICKSKGLEEASAFLLKSINSTEDELILKMLEYYFDAEIDIVIKDNKTPYEEYRDLCALSLDCTNYIRTKNIFYDMEEVEKVMASIR